MEEHIVNKFGNKLRVRACGVLLNENSLLLVKHKGIGEEGIMWLPPGGGVEFGVSLKKNLKREFLEETGLVINVNKFISVCEFLSPPFHALELFFYVDLIEGELALGSDPELELKEQIIEEVRYVTFEELRIISDKQKHPFLHDVSYASDLMIKQQYIE